MIPRRARGDKSTEPNEASEADLARRLLAHSGSPEEKLERLLGERRRELEDQAGRFEEAMLDLERREQLLSDMRSSVERLLRLRASDLGEREVELEELGRDFMERESRLSREEAELARRRSELGAVELKREAVERREQALAAREEEIAAMEVQRAEEELEARHVARGPATRDDPVAVLFVPGPAYRLVDVEPRPLEAGSALELDGEEYVVARLGPAPLPGDARRCAYLERVASGAEVPVENLLPGEEADDAAEGQEGA